MAGHRRRLFTARAALGLLAVGAQGEWILGHERETCTRVCEKRSQYCSEMHWPKSAEDMEGIASALNKTCSEVQRGNVVYDPSIDVDFCGWKGDVNCRCDAKATWPSRRFCWCGEAKDPEPCRPYECTVAEGATEWGEMWPEKKKTWCCDHEGLGCPTTTSTTRSSTTSTKTETPLFYCRGPREGWSSEKQRWCCHHGHGGCTTTVTTSTTTTVTTSTSTFTSTIATIATTAPIAMTIEGAPTTTGPTTQPFDCRKDLSHWHAQWSDDKKLWCCTHYSTGCDSTKPFNCLAGLANWKEGWSSAKRDWCWEHEQRGGPAEFNCFQGDGRDWSDYQRDWCCKIDGLGCPKETYRFRSIGSAFEASRICGNCQVPDAKTCGALLPMPKTRGAWFRLMAAFKNEVAVNHVGNETGIWLGGHWSERRQRWEWNDREPIGQHMLDMLFTQLDPHDKPRLEPWLVMQHGSWRGAHMDELHGIMCERQADIEEIRLV